MATSLAQYQTALSQMSQATFHPTSTVQPDRVGITKAVYIDPTAAAGGNGSLARPFSSWQQIKWDPGTAYLQKAGTGVGSPLVINGQGRADAPIVIGSYGEGAPPAISSAVVFEGAAHVRLEGFQISRSPYSAITLQRGSHHIEIVGNQLKNSTTGIWIGNGAGGSNLIQANEISSNAGMGIGIAQVHNAVGQETSIIGNAVYSNGNHGIQVAGNRFIVEDNVVHNNGLTALGSSGIQLYAGPHGGPFFDGGNYNVVRGNITFANRDSRFFDGNGILLDQGVHHNQVLENFSFANDGAGIVLYDAHDNLVRNNLMMSNSVDSGNTHTLVADFVLNSSLNMNFNNTVSGNTVVGMDDSKPAVWVNDASAGRGNLFGGNTFERFNGSDIYAWANQRGSNQTQWNSLASGGGNDQFDVVPYSIARPGSTYDFSFGANGPVLDVNGGSYQLAGWSSGAGLGLHIL
jgi:parallel beta-helix repeat protein